MPLTIPYDVFPRWYEAFARFVDLIHSDEYEPRQEVSAAPLHPVCVWSGQPLRACGRSLALRRHASRARSGSEHVWGLQTLPAQV